MREIWIFILPLFEFVYICHEDKGECFNIFQSELCLMWYFSPLQVKCDQYWPTRGTETYGLIQVTLLDTVELATYCVRTFALFKVRSICTLLSCSSCLDPTTAVKCLTQVVSVTNLSPSPYSERLQREERGEAVPVHSLARPRGARAPHSVPGLPETGESLQSSRCRAHGGTLQVKNNMVSQKHPEAWNWFCSLHLL